MSALSSTRQLTVPTADRSDYGHKNVGELGIRDTKACS